MTAGVSLVVLLFLLGSSIAVAAGMGLAGLILNGIYSPMPMNRIVGELTWSTTSNFILTAIPFYIMFGEILLRSGTAERMYAALVQWLSWLLIMLACAYSTVTLALSFFFVVHELDFKPGYIMVLVMAALSVGLGLSFKLYFFHFYATPAVPIGGNATAVF